MSEKSNKNISTRDNSFASKWIYGYLVPRVKLCKCRLNESAFKPKQKWSHD